MRHLIYVRTNNEALYSSCRNNEALDVCFIEEITLAGLLR